MGKYILLIVLLLSGCTSDAGRTANGNPDGSSVSEVPVTAERSADSDDLRFDTETPVTHKKNAGFFTLFLIVIIALSLTVLFYIIYQNLQDKADNVNRRIKRLEILREQTEKNRKAINIIKSEQEKIEGRFTEDINNLTHEVNKIAASYQKDENISSDSRVSDQRTDLSNVLNKDEKRIKRKYFKVPDVTGRFVHNKGEDASEGRVYYWIDYQEGKSDAELNYNQGFLDKSAIDQRDSILRPVCEILNPDFFKPNGIRQMKPGKAELIDGYWVVREKIQIEFK